MIFLSFNLPYILHTWFYVLDLIYCMYVVITTSLFDKYLRSLPRFLPWYILTTDRVCICFTLHYLIEAIKVQDTLLEYHLYDLQIIISYLNRLIILNTFYDINLNNSKFCEENRYFHKNLINKLLYVKNLNNNKFLHT